jgi:hypothetical protein
LAGLTNRTENTTPIGKSFKQIYMRFKKASDIYKGLKDSTSKRKNDNIYEIGTVVATKENPNRRLIIEKYIHRTYYCAVVGDAETNNLKYLEQDLVVAPPEESISVVSDL